MFKIAAISDLHASLTKLPNGRRGEISEFLLRRVVQRLNRFIKPDVTVFLGDAVDDGTTSESEALLQTIRAELDRLTSPSIVIPGNHDGDVESFYRFFERPKDIFEVNGVRLLPFLDLDEPGFNALRTRKDLDRFSKARHEFDGPLVALQHVPLYPPGTSDCPYNFVNADEVIEQMRDNGVSLSISGHYHPGMNSVERDGVFYTSSPALCDSPFSYLEISIDDGRIEQKVHTLQIPPELELVDCHLHTHFAYCNHNMDFLKTFDLADSFGLYDLRFCEHTGQLYFPPDQFWRGGFAEQGLDGAEDQNNRAQDYWREARDFCKPNQIGLEVDCDFSGRPVLRDDDRYSAAFMVGSMHFLSEFRKPEPDYAKACDEFIGMLRRFLSYGLPVLAHPFRVFQTYKVPDPQHLFEDVVRLLRESHTAAEINFHIGEPDAEFVKLCVEGGVKLAFSSDAHSLYEVGELWPHLELMKRCGYEGRLKEILLDVN